MDRVYMVDGWIGYIRWRMEGWRRRMEEDRRDGRMRGGWRRRMDEEEMEDVG